MENNTTKEYLQSIRKIKSKIKRLQNKSFDVQDMLSSCTVDPGNEKVDSSKEADRFGTLVAKKVDLDHEIEQCMIEYMDQSKVLEDMFSKLENDKYEDILIDRYIHGMSWKEIAEDMNLSWRWVYTLHGRALEAFRKQVENTESEDIA